MLTYYCEKCNVENKTSICFNCGERTKVTSKIFWCEHCNVPIYNEKCDICGEQGRFITKDIRPVFPEERLLIEIVLGKPFAFRKDSVWNGAGNYYFINGKKIRFSIKSLATVDVESIRAKYQELSEKNTYEYFNYYIKSFITANKDRFHEITSEAKDYIQRTAATTDLNSMFVSFSGGKDSTVVSSLVLSSLGTPKILHIFGDTTLEFPETMKYVQRFKADHRQTPVLSSRNKEKDFFELCKKIGPPSRVMRWCCTVFKTGAITRKIESLFKNKTQITTFYGIRRSESLSRSKYERTSESPKITKQTVVAPIIDWMDFDVWLYILTLNIDFNDAYRLGYARVGCWCCPNNSAWSEFLSKVHMQDEYNSFRNLLVEFAKSIGKPDAERYVDDGNWKARQGGNGLEVANKSIIEFTPCATDENSFNYELQRPIHHDMYELFKPFGILNFDLGNKRLNEVYILSRNGKVRLKLQGRIGTNQLKVTILDHRIGGARSLKVAEEKVKCQLTKYQMCMSCMACCSVCRHDAIMFHTDSDGVVKYLINENKCVGCCECVGHFTGGCYMRKVLAIKRG